ncbi:MAG: hypothetical protein ABI723_15605 [Bacteroidia bacterium]
MKKFLVLLITAASCITASAQNSTPASMPTGKLDGKTFKITLVAKQSIDEKTASTANTKDVAAQGVQRADENVTMSTTTTTGSGSTTTTTNDVKDKNAEMAGNVEPLKDEKTVDAQQPVMAPQDNTAVNNPNDADYSMYSQPLNSKTTLTFSNGMMDSPMMTERKLESCPYKVNASEGDMTAFSATCRSAVPPASAIWSGMVTGNSIKGNVSYRLGNGRVIDYSFTGTTAATKKTSSKGKASSGIQKPSGATE